MTLFHLLFGLVNLGMAHEDDAAVTVPLGEGIVLVFAAIGLVVAIVLLLRRQVFRSTLTIFVATVPVAIFFAFTVPEHSDTEFFFAALLLPVVSALVMAATRIAGTSG